MVGDTLLELGRRDWEGLAVLVSILAAALVAVVAILSRDETISYLALVIFSNITLAALGIYKRKRKGD